MQPHTFAPRPTCVGMVGLRPRPTTSPPGFSEAAVAGVVGTVGQLHGFPAPPLCASGPGWVLAEPALRSTKVRARRPPIHPGHPWVRTALSREMPGSVAGGQALQALTTARPPGLQCACSWLRPLREMDVPAFCSKHLRLAVPEVTGASEARSARTVGCGGAILIS